MASKKAAAKKATAERTAAGLPLVPAVPMPAAPAPPGFFAQLLADLRTPGRVRKLAVYLVTIVAALLAANLIPETYRHYAEAVITIGGFLGIYAVRNDHASTRT